MEPLTLEGLNLSKNAVKFVKEHLQYLDKQLRIVRFPDDYPHFASMMQDGDCYVIGIRTNVDKNTLDTNFCHELYHAYQMGMGFPMAIGHAPDTEKYCENLRSTILDLSANDAVKSYGLTYDSVIKVRYSQVKHLCATSFKEINTPFARDLLSIDLILDLSDLSPIQQDKILQRLKTNLPYVYNLYHEFHSVIFEQHDYHTKEGCLAIFAYIFNRIGLWPAASIRYQGNQFRSFEALKRATQSTAEA